MSDNRTKQAIAIELDVLRSKMRSLGYAEGYTQACKMCAAADISKENILFLPQVNLYLVPKETKAVRLPKPTHEPLPKP